MNTVIRSRYTNRTGKVMHYIILNGAAYTLHTEDEQHNAEYARALYHQCRAPKRLVDWNSDTQVETELDRE